MFASGIVFGSFFTVETAQVARVQRFGKSPRVAGPCGSPKFKRCEIAFFPSVGNFVTAKAPDFSKVQQTSTSGPQTFQQESLRIHKVLQSSTGFGIWFGTRRPVVQIHSSRPFFSSGCLERLIFSSHDCRRF